MPAASRWFFYVARLSAHLPLLGLLLLDCRSSRVSAERDSGAPAASPALAPVASTDGGVDAVVSLAARHPFQRSSGPSPTAELDARVLEALGRGDRTVLSRIGTPELDTSVALRLEKDLSVLRPEYLRFEQSPQALAAVYGLASRTDGGSVLVHELVLGYVGAPNERKLARIVSFGW